MCLSLYHLPCLPLQPPQPSPISSYHDPLFPRPTSPTSLRFPVRNSPKSIPRAASLSGSAAEFPEQVVGDAPPRKPKKRRSVAGVDQEELLDPEKLADPDSFFCEINGVQVHHKVCRHEEREEGEVKAESFGVPMILLHGFGASVFSWDRVMKPLARVIRSRVLAFDRPAFGLTSRVNYFGQPGSGGGDARPLNPYSMAFSVMATLSFIDLLGAGRAILMGHSAGCLVAVNTYFEAPERVAALILVAPAIVAPLVLKKVKKENGAEKEKQVKGDSSLSAREDPFTRIWKGLSTLYKLISGLVLQMLKGMRDIVGSLYTKALCAVLRSALAVNLVRVIMDRFGIVAIRNAWYDANQVTEHVVRGYTKPLKVKGWETALLEYTIAMLTDAASKLKPPLTRRLAEIKCPVLIVTGDTDRLVPSWNAERLSQAIPDSTFEVIRNCGHLPHEERAEEFLTIVESFFHRVFAAQEKFSQAMP